MIKYFTYNISNFTGYRLKVEESNLKSFAKIICNGFKIVRKSTIFLDYEIDLKLIRNLKLKKIANLIRPISVEDKILQLLERSKEIENNNYSTFEIYSAHYYEAIDYESEAIFRTQNKDRNRHQSKIYAQKAKQYENKARFY